MNKRCALGVLLLVASGWFHVAGASSEEMIEEIYLLVREKEILAFSAVGDR
jgi:hypothetical protein